MPTHYQGTGEERLALDLYIKLLRAANSVGNRSTQIVGEAGLSPTQFGVLETLYHLGPLKISQLADKHLKSRNNFTTVIDNLEKQGLVKRERDGQDRRAILVHLTPEGRDRVGPMIPRFVRGVVAEMGVLTLDEQRQMCNMLGRLGRQETAAVER